MQIVSFLRTNRNLAALVAGFLATALGWWWWTSVPQTASRPKGFTPATELERIAYAVRNARSWRVTVFGTMHGEEFRTDQDVVCPYDSHSITETRAKDGTVEPSGEVIQTRDTFYAREGRDRWSAQPRAAIDQCARGPMAGPGPLVSLLENLKGTTRMEPGATASGRGSGCRIWNFFSPSSRDAMGSVCVDEATHLPYEIQLGSLHVQYSDWNMPIQIVPPEVDLPEAVPQP